MLSYFISKKINNLAILLLTLFLLSSNAYGAVLMSSRSTDNADDLKFIPFSRLKPVEYKLCDIARIPPYSPYSAPIAVDEVSPEPEIFAPIVPVASVSNDFFNDAIFIGNSRTQGLKIYSSAHNLKVYAGKGINLLTVFTSALVKSEDSLLTIPEAIQAEPCFSRVYINFGINELGWKGTQSFVAKYSALIDTVKSINSEATIIVQSIIPVEDKISDNDRYITNSNVRIFNEAIKNMCIDKGVVFADVYSEFADENGNLPKLYSYDGIHLTADGYEKWLNYLKLLSV